MSRLSSIVLRNTATTVTLPVYGGLPDDKYILMGADGLGPPEIDVAFGQSVYRGSIYQGSIPKDREIVLLIGLNQNYRQQTVPSIAQLRAEFYKFIAASEPITITLNIAQSSIGDYVPSTMQTVGYIRRAEFAPFSKVPQVQLTISCPSPLMESPTSTNVPFTPTVSSPGSFTVSYEGTALAGFEYEFTLVSAPAKIVVRTMLNTSYMENLTIPGPRVIGEKFKINTNPIGRRVYWLAPSPPTAFGDITGMCTIAADAWPSIHPGSTKIDILDGNGAVLSVITTRFVYTAKYWGL